MLHLNSTLWQVLNMKKEKLGKFYERLSDSPSLGCSSALWKGSPHVVLTFLQIVVLHPGPIIWEFGKNQNLKLHLRLSDSESAFPTGNSYAHQSLRSPVWQNHESSQIVLVVIIFPISQMKQLRLTREQFYDQVRTAPPAQRAEHFPPYNVGLTVGFGFFFFFNCH